MRHHRCWSKPSSALLVIGCVVAGILGPLGVAQAATKTSSYYVSLGDSYLGRLPTGPRCHTRLHVRCGEADTSHIGQFRMRRGDDHILDLERRVPGCAATHCRRSLVPHDNASDGGRGVPHCSPRAHRPHHGVNRGQRRHFVRDAGQPNQLRLHRRGHDLQERDQPGHRLPRTAAGPHIPLIGLTYPDVILGGYVYPSQPATASRISLAKLSVVVFKSLINPGAVQGLRIGQRKVGGRDCGDGCVHLTHPNSPSPTLRHHPGAGRGVCTLTWFCSQGNIHATTKGYTFIGKLVVAKFVAMRRT